MAHRESPSGFDLEPWLSIGFELGSAEIPMRPPSSHTSLSRPGPRHALAWVAVALAGAAFVAWLAQPDPAPNPQVQSNGPAARAGTDRASAGQASIPLSSVPATPPAATGSDPFRQFLTEHPGGMRLPAASQPPADPFRQAAEDAERRHASAGVSPFGATRP
ncbi:MAG: hypothetical protein ACXWJM_11705 [Ramlibacter sp.]